MTGLGPFLAAWTLSVPLLQGSAGGPHPPSPHGKAPPPPSTRVVEWTPGDSIALRIPVASPDHAFLTSLSFPEENLETAVSGWGEGELTALPKRGMLFLRLSRRTQGELHVLGGSGALYVLRLTGADPADPSGFDASVRIVRKADARPPDAVPRRARAQPGGALVLAQAMRLGLRPEGVRIFRADAPPRAISDSLELRLRYIYDASSYWGLIYDVRNRTDEARVLDASRLRGAGATVVLTALRENLIPPGRTTRLYAVVWKG